MTGPLIVNFDFEGLPLTSTVKCLSKPRITREVPSCTRQRRSVTIVPLHINVGSSMEFRDRQASWLPCWRCIEQHSLVINEKASSMVGVEEKSPGGQGVVS